MVGNHADPQCGACSCFRRTSYLGLSVLNRYQTNWVFPSQPYSDGVFYIRVSDLPKCSPWYIPEGKMDRLARLFEAIPPTSAAALQPQRSGIRESLATNSIDYIFTDPPFGENIYYSDLNILVESWHGSSPASETEAIVDRVKEKTPTGLSADDDRLLPQLLSGAEARSLDDC